MENNDRSGWTERPIVAIIGALATAVSLMGLGIALGSGGALTEPGSTTPTVTVPETNPATTVTVTRSTTSRTAPVFNNLSLSESLVLGEMDGWSFESDIQITGTSHVEALVFETGTTSTATFLIGEDLSILQARVGLEDRSSSESEGLLEIRDESGRLIFAKTYQLGVSDELVLDIDSVTGLEISVTSTNGNELLFGFGNPILVQG